MSVEVSVLVVTYNSGRHIEACLDSVFEQSDGISQEVIVVDNGSTDDTVTIVESRFPNVRLLLPGRNLGFAAGVNCAARHARGNYLLLLNPDTVVLDRAVSRLIEFARCHSAFGLFGGRAQKTDGSLEPSSCWGLPTLWSLVMFATGLSTLGRRNLVLNPESLGRWERDTVREVGMISGCFLLVRRAIWTELGGFDERYFMYGEDADLATRGRQAGYRSIICPAARLVHEVGQSSDTPLHKALMLFRGKATYVRTHWTGVRRDLGLWLLLTGVGLRAAGAFLLATTRHHTNKSAWSGLWRERRAWLRGYQAVDSRPRVEETVAV